MSLHDALITGDFPKARWFIRKRIGINSPDEDGDSPLMLAVRHPGMEYLTQLLLTAGARVDMRNNVGETTIMLAAHSPNNQENVNILIHSGADTRLITHYGQSACDYALNYSHYDWLFPDNSDRRALRATLSNGDLEVVGALCRNQAIDANLFRFVLLDAVYSEDILRAELLLEMGVTANWLGIHGWSALMQAACRAHLELVRLLLRDGADPQYQDHEGRSALGEMATCVHGLRITELIYCEAYAEKVLGKERLMEIKAAQVEMERLLVC